MDRVMSAGIKTDSSKTCFVSLSEDLAEALGRRIQGQAFALHLQWPSGGAFTSWSGEVIHTRKDDSLTGSSSVIQLGRKFAVSLGLEEGEQVLVQPVTSILSCNRLCVDPISANDWEILELHAGYIENELLNQVRVVFLGQLLPIWIEKTICVVVKIVGLEPKASCLRLDEFTEVVVSPKTRNFASTKLGQQASLSSAKSATPPSSGTSQTTHQDDTKSNFHHSNTISGNSQSPSPRCSVFEHSGQSSAVDKSFLSRLSSYFSSFLDKSVDQDHTSEGHDPTSTSLVPSGDKLEGDMNNTSSRGKLVTKDFEDIDIDLKLRVQPETKLNCHKSYTSREAGFSKNSAINCYSQQPSTVFVDFASLPPPVLISCSHCFSTFPPPDGKVVKIVGIKKLASPKERAASQVSNTANRREGLDTRKETTAGDADDVAITTSASDSSPVENVTVRWIARMVMISSKNSDLINQTSNEVTVQNSVQPGHIALSKELVHVLGAGDLSIVKLQSISHGPLEINGIILHPFGDTLHDVTADTAIEAFEDWLSLVSSKEFPLVLCSGMLVSCSTSQGDHIQFTVTVLSHQKSYNAVDVLQYYHLTPETLQRVTVVLGAPASSLQGSDEGLNPRESHSQILKHSVGELGGVTESFGKCLDHALSCLNQRQIIAHLGGNVTTGLRRGALLICGSGSGAGIGCGKTSLAHAVCCKLQQWPVFAHVAVVDCIPFRGKRVDVIQKNWQQIFAEAAWHQPSAILFDDLDQVISAPSALQELGGESLYKYRLARVFKDLINKEIISNSKVVVIATARSCDSLHPLLLTSRGCHIFQCCVELHPPDTHQREAILRVMISRKLDGQTSDGLEVGSLLTKTEGFSPKDLSSLVDCALHMAAVRNVNVSGENGVCSNITMEDFKEALEGFTPAALRGVSLHTAGELGWSDVGGLVKVKEALVETLLWPTKYSWLFKKCPLRLRSGLLLYGPPGTGKTLLAGVVAKECGLNFISIKGPELLSKYIGASEQAVRDMFTRAQSAKPCILFFDEFDSLAPRRGHDNTGVTDRVVNQLLTQLDGVEGLDGVYVLAATSRPDLIDPALLRPGRLDKCLYCGIPEKSERLEILQALSKSLLLAGDTDLRIISDSCENFTGADFKALLYNAQLAAIHRSTSNSQLYKGVLAGGENQDIHSKGLQHEDLVYIPSLAEGAAKDLSADVLTRLQSEVATIQENLCETNGSMTGQKLTRRSDSSSSQVSSGLQISQSDLLEAASSMGPSVSDSERIRYQAIYDTFIKSKGGEFNHSNPGQGKATLA